jgi:hypothetical protein
MKYIVEIVSNENLKFTKFQQHFFRHSDNIKVITSTICEFVVLVLPMGGIS